MLWKDRVVVTAVADQTRVGAGTLERRARVVEMAELEALLRVAALAFRRERSRRNLRDLRSLPRGLVVNVLMASGAEISNRLVSNGDRGPVGEAPSFRAVTVGAENLRVSSVEQEPGVPVVCEPKVLGVKAVRRVARFAVRVELAVVNVDVAALARGLEGPIADGGRFPAREQGILLRAVAFGADDGLVTTGQRVSALCVVEANAVETLHLVAARAVLFELPDVRVLAVAVGAFAKGDPAKALSGVTLGAGEPDMLAQQRETGSLVVELRFLPGRLRVARLAIGPEARPMRVLMAVGAAGESKPFPLLVRMALLALDLPMGAHETETRAIVIETAFAERQIDGVAVGAARSEPSPMHVFVAGDAAVVVQQKRFGLRTHRSVRGPVTGVAAPDL
jgi:hypothetical protein